MARRRGEIALVYVAGLAQGFALVVVPAASSLLTDPAAYGFSSAAYGALFIPMVIAAVIASAAGGVLVLRWGLKRLFLTGLVLDVIAMGLVALSALVLGAHTAAYVLLLGAMLALGGGFGATLTAANRLAPGFFPDRAEPALTALHALLGTGTALAPLLVSAASGAGWWWIPAAVAAVLLALALAAATRELAVAGPTAAAPPQGPLALFKRTPGVLWAFIAIVVLYGICETLYGNWAVLYLHHGRAFSQRTAGLALAVFWGMVTLGRIVIAVLSVWVPARWFYRALPLLLVAALLIVPHAATPLAAVVAFGAGGLACSAFLPLSVSFAEERSPALAEVMAGEMMAAYMIGYGIASFGVGPLVGADAARLGIVYAWASLLAVAMVLLAIALEPGGGRPSPTR
jgi:fucose permease